MRCALTAAFLSALILPNAFAQRMLFSSPFRPGTDGYGSVTLTWSAPAGTPVEIHLASPSGELVSAAGSSGSAQTGPWVTDGTRFFLQDVTNGSPGVTLSSLTIHPPLPRPRMPQVPVHLLFLGATLTNPSVPETPGAILIFDGDTTDQLARLNFSAAATPAAASPDGNTLYVSLQGTPTGIAVVDVGTLSIRTFIPVAGLSPGGVLATGAGGISRLIVPAAGGMALIDPATNTLAGSVPCPFAPSRILYNPLNQTTYGFLTGQRQDVCVVTPQFQAGPSLNTGQTPTQVLLLDNGASGQLLVSTWNTSGSDAGTYTSIALDLGTGASFPVPSLRGVFPTAIALQRRPVLYGALPQSGGPSLLQRFALAFAADGAPIFQPQLSPPPEINGPALADNRFLYVGIPSYCATVEGPVFGCTAGFQLFDAQSLQPEGSILVGQYSSVVMGYITYRSLTGPLLRTRLH